MADMRDRLIELIGESKYWLKCDQLADYLIEHGVILPPCKVGDTVWEINNENPFEEDLRVMESKVDAFLVATSIDLHSMDSKWLFLTREEAEKALREKEK